MGRRDERSGTTDNNTTNVSERKIARGWAAKNITKRGDELVKEVEKLEAQRKAGGNDRN